MKRLLIALVFCPLPPVALAAPAVATPVAVSPVRAAASAACERAAQDTLRETRGATAAASFNAPAALVPGAADASDITLRGAGQVRTPSGSRSFAYSCTYDTRAGAVAGVVVRDASTNEPTATLRPVEPDLSQISPAACESAAAGALKRRWPGVAHISFNADTRQLSQDAGGVANLHGQGIATPTVRDAGVHFSYDCAIDARNGRVMKVVIGN